MILFIFSIKEKMTYKIPTQCGKILYKKEIVEGTTIKSNVIYETRKRFTIAWSDGTISEKYPLDNDYYRFVSLKGKVLLRSKKMTEAIDQIFNNQSLPSQTNPTCPNPTATTSAGC